MIKITPVQNRVCEVCEGEADIRVQVADAEFIICHKCSARLWEALRVSEINNISVRLQHKPFEGRIFSDEQRDYKLAK